VADARGNTQYVNAAVERVAGRRREEVLGLSLASWLPCEDRRVLRESWEAARSGQPYRGVAAARTPDGLTFQAEVRACAVPEEGGAGRVIVTVRDGTRERELQARLDDLVRHDALTGLPNRTGFLEILDGAVARARQEGLALAAAVLVVDRFKSLSSVFGAEAGEEVLRWVATGLRAATGSGGVAARLGSSEFGVLRLGPKGADPAEELRELVRGLSGDPEVPVTASAGIAAWPRDGEDARALLRCADLALAQAKAQGRNSARSFSGDLDARVSEIVLMETRLFHALANREYEVAYQPYFDLETSALTGGEALIRWRNAELGAVSPAKFIPSLEETGMIVEVGEWVLRTACRQLREWKGPTPIFSLSVNLSLGQLRDEDLVARVAEAIRDSQADPRRLTLEVTESTVMNDVDFSCAVLRRLRDLGVSIAVDDFGTGYSSLSYLKKLPVDCLKIDRSFVRDVTRDPDTASIVTAITAVARSLDLRTIAEGVESQEQVNVLRLLRCDMGQGYHFSPAVSASDFAAYLTRWHGSREASLARIP
jgi:diguanylate cyclase (GGDEF)-like protein/PAS domain S-box-containing protein